MRQKNIKKFKMDTISTIVYLLKPGVFMSQYWT